MWTSALIFVVSTGMLDYLLLVFGLSKEPKLKQLLRLLFSGVCSGATATSRPVRSCFKRYSTAARCFSVVLVFTVVVVLLWSDMRAGSDMETSAAAHKAGSGAVSARAAQREHPRPKKGRAGKAVVHPDRTDTRGFATVQSDSKAAAQTWLSKHSLQTDQSDDKNTDEDQSPRAKAGKDAEKNAHKKSGAHADADVGNSKSAGKKELKLKLGHALDKRKCRFPPAKVRDFLSGDNVEKMADTFFKSETEDRTPYIDFKGRNRFHSYPLLSGDGFRMMAQIICDETGCSMDAKDQQPNTTIPYAHNKTDAYVVFAKPEFLAQVEKNILAKTDRDIVLITQISFINVPDKFAHLLDHPRLRAWLSKNANMTHAKMRPVPIGVESRWGKVGSKPHLYFHWMSHSTDLPPTKDVFVSFKVATWPAERQQCLDHLESQSFSTVRQKMFDQKHFFRAVLDHCFVACPRGSGVDTHRMFETLILGRFPITRRDHIIDRLYYDLPLLVVDDWTDVTEDYLDDAYRQLLDGRYNMHKLFAPYWLEFVRYVQTTPDWNAPANEWDACMVHW